MLRRALRALLTSLALVACAARAPSPAQAPPASSPGGSALDTTAPEPGGPAVAADAWPGPAASAPGGIGLRQPTSDAIPIGPDDAVWGSALAPVTIVEFQDLECPFCARAQPTIEALERRYGPERLRVVFKHNPLPFHRGAMPAALASQAIFELAGSEAFFAFTGALFRNQRALSDALYEDVARRLRVDVGQFRRTVAAARTRDKIQADMGLAARIGATGTPNFRINGVELSGAQPLERFVEIIDAELAAVNQARAAGAEPARSYPDRVVVNYRPPAPSAPPAPGVAAARVDDPDARDTTVWKIPVGSSPVQGPASALVTIVEFSDLECPFCKRVQPTLAELMRRYAGKLRIVWKHDPLPFHSRALPAALVAVEARAQKGDAGFFKAVEAIYGAPSGLEDDQLLAIAGQLGLSVPRVERALAKKTHKAIIDADVQLALDFKASGTPHFFINGRRLVGAQSLEKFAERIDEALAEANALVASGVRPADVYTRLMRDAKDPPGPEQRVVAAPTAKNPSRGPASAPIVVQMWADFQCPFCARAIKTMKDLEQAYPGRVRIVWRNLPLGFHRDARLAAEAALEAYAQKGSAGFWKMHDLLFENQAAPGGLERDALLGYAAKLGLDRRRFERALDEAAHEDVISADEAAARAAQISGTPAFVINGYFVSGAQRLERFKSVVDYALKHPVKR